MNQLKNPFGWVGEKWLVSGKSWFTEYTGNRNIGVLTYIEICIK